MKLTYGRVQLDLVTIDGVDRKAIWTPDGTTMLYNEWNIVCSCIFAPAVGTVAPYTQHQGGTSVEITSGLAIVDDLVPGTPPQEPKAGGNGSIGGTLSSGNRPIPPGGTGGSRIEATFINGGAGTGDQRGGPRLVRYPDFTMPGTEGPVITDRVLQTQLAIPRQRLIITAWDPKRAQDVYWLVSPEFGRTCDARNGPIVKASPVVQLHGDGQAFGVQLNITTWIPPCGDFDKAILAHRWQMTHTQDPDFYLTRQVTGELYFNASVFNAPGQNIRADFLTKELFHPIPFGFRRNVDFVKRSPDGLVIAYGYSDTDQSVTFDPVDTAATQMQVHETSAYIAPFTGISYLTTQAAQLGDWLKKKLGV